MTFGFGFSPETLVKLVAYFEIVLSIFNFLAISFNTLLILTSPTAFCQLIQSNPGNYKSFVKFLELDHEVQIITLLLLLLLCVLGLGLGLLLLTGTKTRSLSQIKAWRVLTTILYMLCLPLYICWLIYSDDIITLVVSFVGIYFVAGLSFYVVYILIIEIEIKEAERLLSSPSLIYC